MLKQQLANEGLLQWAHGASERLFGVKLACKYESEIFEKRLEFQSGFGVRMSTSMWLVVTFPRYDSICSYFRVSSKAFFFIEI